MRTVRWALFVACVYAVAGEGAAPAAASPKLTPASEGATVPNAAPGMKSWQFRWDKTSPVQGPYPTAQMVKYAKQGYFAQSNEPALVHLVGQKESWLPYDTIDFVAYADFMSQAELRAAGKPHFAHPCQAPTNTLAYSSTDRVRQASALVERMDESDRDALLKVMEKTDDMQTRLMESADRTPAHSKLGEALLGDSDSNAPEFITTGVFTSATRQTSPPSCVVAPSKAPAQWMPNAVAAAGFACPEGKSIVAHVNDLQSPVIRLSGKAADDSAETAKWWVEHDKREMMEQENEHLRKHMMPSPQEMELGESASTTAGATEMAFSRFSTSLHDLHSDVSTVAKKYRHKMTGQQMLEHPIVQKQTAKCEVNPEYDQNLGESGDLELAKLVMDTTLKQHDWNHKRMMTRATEILTHARLATEVAVSTAAQRYNRQMTVIAKMKNRKSDVKELGESEGTSDSESMTVQAKAQMTAMESAAMGSLKRIKDEGFQVIRTIFNQMKRPDDKMISTMACNLMTELKKKRVTRRQTLVKRTELQPYRVVTLQAVGEAPGGGRLACSDTNPVAGDTKGYGYAGGNNCGSLKVKVVSEGQAGSIVKGANNNTVILFRDVLDSNVWEDPNLRWSQPSPKDHTMTKSSYKLLGDKIGMTSPRADEVEKKLYTHQWLSTCPKTCRSCQGGKPGDDCYHSNLHNNYPLPWNAMIDSKHNSFDSLLRSSPVVSGAAILNMDDTGKVSALWPYGWKKHIMRESVSKGAFWDSNTAAGPYVRCGICKTTTCISNAKGLKFTYYNRKNTNKLCSKEELQHQRQGGGDVESAGDGQDSVDGVSAQHLLQNIALKKLKATECIAQKTTSQYCTTKARAECMYIQYCQRGDWNCDSQSGWSDPIYDCSKVVSNTGITGDEWCSQLAL